MRQRAAQERGQTAAEYLGVLVLVAFVVVVLFSLGIGGTIASGIERAVCEISGGESCGPRGEQPRPVPSPAPPPPAVDPQLAPDERATLLSDPQEAQEILDDLSEAERRWLQRHDPQAAQAVEEAISWEEQRAIVDSYIDAPLEDFLAYRAFPGHDPRLDYSTDGCSAPLVGSTGVSFDFTDACLRHDFGYRNTKELDLFQERKAEIDARFYEDMKDHCATRSVFLQARCYDWARHFHAGVVVFG